MWTGSVHVDRVGPCGQGRSMWTGSVHVDTVGPCGQGRSMWTALVYAISLCGLNLSNTFSCNKASAVIISKIQQ
jgi:hypothetical protein